MSNERDRERHERVIHTRVPESLEAELKERAEELGVSVSNLVRNVLNHALGLVDGVIRDSEQIARSARDGIDAGVRAARGGRPRPGAAAPGPATARAAAVADLADEPAILGWQKLVLERNALCSRCNDILPRGTDAAFAVVDGAFAGPRPVLCLRCLDGNYRAPEVRDGSDHE